LPANAPREECAMRFAARPACRKADLLLHYSQ
jgi:hypothetical protein